MSQIDIIALGYIFHEKIVWPDGRVEGPFLGSTASYGAVALGRLGMKAGLVSNIGPNTPKSLLEPLYQCGIDLKGLNVIEGAEETKNVLTYYPDGTKKISYLTRAPLITFEHIPKDYLNAKVFHFCLVDYEVPIETLGAIRQVNSNAMFTVDLGGVGGAHSTDATRHRYTVEQEGALQKEYLSYFAIGKASVEDAQLAFGRQFENPKEVALAYIDCGLNMVIVTMGGDGAYILTDEHEEFYAEAVPTVSEVRDTTGAGDTYITAFVSKFMESSDIMIAAKFASATSSLLIEKTGGVDIQRTPTREQVMERLKYFGV